MLGNGFTKQSRLKVRTGRTDFYPEEGDLAYRGISVSVSSATEAYFLQSLWLVLPSGEAMPLNPSPTSGDGIYANAFQLPFLLAPTNEYSARVDAERLVEALKSRHHQGVASLTALVVDSTGAFHCSEPFEFDMGRPPTWRPTPELQEYRRAVEQRMLAQG